MTTQDNLYYCRQCICRAILGLTLVTWCIAPAQAQRPSIAAMQAQIAALEAFVNPLQTYVDVDDTTDPAKPVVRVTAANLQIVNGAGTTDAIPNGVGNLLVGYDEARTTGAMVCSFGAFANEPSCVVNGGVWSLVHKSGSHNVVIGQDHNYSQTAGLVAGLQNTVNAAYASVSGGYDNTASGLRSSVSGGQTNTASATYSRVSGGFRNTASGLYSSVSGGQFNSASGSYSSVSGGLGRTATGDDDWAAGALFQEN